VGGGYGLMRTGPCIGLIAGGAILRFALTTSSTHGLNVHTVGVILMLAGLLGLVLSLFVWGPWNPRRRVIRTRHDGAAPVVEERRVYREQPPVVEERPLYRDDPPL
jgi:hypothetical protein